MYVQAYLINYTSSQTKCCILKAIVYYLIKISYIYISKHYLIIFCKFRYVSILKLGGASGKQTETKLSVELLTQMYWQQREDVHESYFCSYFYFGKIFFCIVFRRDLLSWKFQKQDRRDTLAVSFSGPSSPFWPLLVLSGPFWQHLVPSDNIWFLLTPSGPFRHLLAIFGFFYLLMIASGSF